MSSPLVTRDHPVDWLRHAPSKGQVKTHISHLPEEVILLIFEKLPFSSILNVQAVCRSWSQLAQDNCLWRKGFFELFRRTLISAIEQKGDLNFRDCVIRQKRIERALHCWPNDKVNAVNPVSIGESHFYPGKVAFQGGKIYFCKDNLSNRNHIAPNSLCVIDPASVDREDVPLAIEAEDLFLHHKQISIEAFNAKYLITRCRMKRKKAFGLLNDEYEKFYVYEAKTKQLLWGSEGNQLCAEIFSSAYPKYLFSRVRCEDKKSWVIIAHDLQTGESRNLTRGFPSNLNCALSGLVQFSEKGSKRVIYLKQNQQGNGEFFHLKCKQCSNISAMGNIVCQQFDSRVFLLKLGKSGYTEIPLGRTAATEFFLSNDSLWSISLHAITKVDLRSYDSWAIPKSYEYSRVAGYEHYFIEETYCSQCSYGREVTVLDPRTGKKTERNGGIESIVYAAQTGKKLARIPELLISNILGFEKHFMIVWERGRELKETALIEIFNLQVKPVSSRLVSLPAVAVYKCFYRNGVLFYLGKSSWFSTQQWFYLDIAALL